MPYAIALRYVYLLFPPEATLAFRMLLPGSYTPVGIAVAHGYAVVIGPP